MGWTILKSFFQDKTSVNIGGILEGLDVFSIIDTLVKNEDISIVYVVKNEDKLYKTTQLIDELYSDINYVTIPAWDCLPYDNLSPGTRVTGERINSFLKILDKNNPVRLVLITVSALIQKNIPLENYPKSVKKITIGGELNLSMGSTTTRAISPTTMWAASCASRHLITSRDEAEAVKESN